MATQFTMKDQPAVRLAGSAWINIGLAAAGASIVAVLAVQALAIALWPEIALFKPLESYLRSAVFTLVPAGLATGLLAWLTGHTARPVSTFVKIALVILLVSIIPDYILPVPYRTFLASSVAAFLHIVAGIITVLVLVTGYQRKVVK